MKSALYSSVAVLLLLAACDKPANNSGSSTDHNRTDERTAPPKADNTANNERDKNKTVTPIDQSNAQSDIDITAAIRRTIVDDASMSTNAKNIKIVTDKGAVSLRGVVDSQAEKDTIESRAKAVAGVVSVDNQLEVKTN